MKMVDSDPMDWHPETPPDVLPLKTFGTGHKRNFNEYAMDGEVQLDRGQQYPPESLAETRSSSYPLSYDTNFQMHSIIHEDALHLKRGGSWSQSILQPLTATVSNLSSRALSFSFRQISRVGCYAYANRQRMREKCRAVIQSSYNTAKRRLVTFCERRCDFSRFKIRRDGTSSSQPRWMRKQSPTRKAIKHVHWQDEQHNIQDALKFGSASTASGDEIPPVSLKSSLFTMSGALQDLPIEGQTIPTRDHQTRASATSFESPKASADSKIINSKFSHIFRSPQNGSSGDRKHPRLGGASQKTSSVYRNSFVSSSSRLYEDSYSGFLNPQRAMSTLNNAELRTSTDFEPVLPHGSVQTYRLNAVAARNSLNMYDKIDTLFNDGATVISFDDEISTLINTKDSSLDLFERRDNSPRPQYLHFEGDALRHPSCQQLQEAHDDDMDSLPDHSIKPDELNTSQSLQPMHLPTTFPLSSTSSRARRQSSFQKPLSYRFAPVQCQSQTGIPLLSAPQINESNAHSPTQNSNPLDSKIITKSSIASRGYSEPLQKKSIGFGTRLNGKPIAQSSIIVPEEVAEYYANLTPNDDSMLSTGNSSQVSYDSPTQLEEAEASTCKFSNHGSNETECLLHSPMTMTPTQRKGYDIMRSWSNIPRSSSNIPHNAFSNEFAISRDPSHDQLFDRQSYSTPESLSVKCPDEAVESLHSESNIYQDSTYIRTHAIKENTFRLDESINIDSAGLSVDGNHGPSDQSSCLDLDLSIRQNKPVIEPENPQAKSNVKPPLDRRGMVVAPQGFKTDICTPSMDEMPSNADKKTLESNGVDVDMANKSLYEINEGTIDVPQLTSSRRMSSPDTRRASERLRHRDSDRRRSSLATSQKLTESFTEMRISRRSKSVRKASIERKEQEARAEQAASKAVKENRRAEEEAQRRARKEQEDAEEKNIKDRERYSKIDIRRMPREKIIQPLNTFWEAKVKQAMDTPNMREVLVTSSAGTSLTRRDFGTLKVVSGRDPAHGWLNDEIILACLQQVVDYGLRVSSHKPGQTPTFHAFNTFFYKNLRDKGAQSVKRWATRAKIGTKDLNRVRRVFIPVHQGAHWTLLVVSPIARTIEYFDSLGGSADDYIRNAKSWLASEMGKGWNEEEWSVPTGSHGAGPRQTNGSDCGVFTCTTARMVVLGVDPMAYGGEDMKVQRERMVAELLNGGLTGDFEPKVVFLP